ncbi:hypothetical protein J6590_096440 [Homalodisca vitripennis]|nr:hypothetical protein J6590_096440 [Homalodisca vitripennis]
MKRQRENSPVSENTLVDLISQSSTVQVIDSVHHKTDSLDDSSLYSDLSDSDIINDSDKDPTFDPEQPAHLVFRISTSTSGIQNLSLPLLRPRLSVVNDDLLSMIVTKTRHSTLSNQHICTSGIQNLSLPLLRPRLSVVNSTSTSGIQNLSLPLLRPRLSVVNSTSTSGIQNLSLPLIRPRLSVVNDDLLSSSDEEDNASAFTIPQVPPPRMYRRGLGGGRRRAVGRGRVSSRPNQDDSSSWDEVDGVNDPGYIHNFTYSELPGPKHCPPVNSLPISYFNLFFTVNILTSFVTETNRYAAQYISSLGGMISPHSRVNEWTTLQSMK